MSLNYDNTEIGKLATTTIPLETLKDCGKLQLPQYSSHAVILDQEPTIQASIRQNLKLRSTPSPNKKESKSTKSRRVSLAL